MWIRPEPVLDVDGIKVVTGTSNIPAVARALCGDGRSLIGDQFPIGLKIANRIRRELGGHSLSDDFAENREFRSKYRAATQKLLVPITDGQIALEKAPEIGWLSELYGDLSQFYLPFPQVQGLNSSWQWYTKGIELPVLGRRLHPFHGTYFPTRFEHLELFGTWLHGYRGPKKVAYDIGAGCGVLSFQLCRRGFENVIATDINPNAIESIRRDIHRLEVPPPIDLHVADLFGERRDRADVIVFNPPWLPGEAHGPLDRAMYYPHDLFERFFRAAEDRLAPDGRVVMVFSNLIKTESDAPHPIEAEIDTGGTFALENKLTRKVRASSKKTRRRNRSKRERVELWVLNRAQ